MPPKGSKQRMLVVEPFDDSESDTEMEEAPVSPADEVENKKRMSSFLKFFSEKQKLDAAKKKRPIINTLFNFLGHMKHGYPKPFTYSEILRVFATFHQHAAKKEILQKEKQKHTELAIFLYERSVAIEPQNAIAMYAYSHLKENIEDIHLKYEDTIKKQGNSSFFEESLEKYTQQLEKKFPHDFENIYTELLCFLNNSPAMKRMLDEKHMPPENREQARSLLKP